MFLPGLTTNSLKLHYFILKKSIQLHDSIEGLIQMIVSVTLHYIDIEFFAENKVHTKEFSIIKNEQKISMLCSCQD